MKTTYQKQTPQIGVIKYKFLIFSVLLFLNNFSFSQTSFDYIKNILPPSTEASSLSKYSDYPVSTSTGVPDIKIPLYSISAGGISVPVSLNYHASGVKVDELSNFVGLGWSLNAGGMISRIIKDEPDESVNGFMRKGAIYPYPLDLTIPFHHDFSVLACNPEKNSSQSMDTEPDIFSFNIDGYSGKFFLDGFGNIRLMPYQDIKIVVDGSGLNNFILTLPTGTKYYFGYGQVSSSHVQSGNYLGVDLVTSWHLSKITNPLNSQEINLQYEDYAISYDFSYNETFAMPVTSAFSLPVINQWNLPSCGSTGFNYSKTIKFEKGKQLTKIISNNKILEFKYIGGRLDLISNTGGQHRLEKIQLKSNSGVLESEQVLTTNFIQSNSGAGWNAAASSSYRMYLDELKLSFPNGNNEPPYKFNYYNRSLLPYRFSYNQDHWGYFNGANNSHFIPSINKFLLERGVPPTESDVNREVNPNFSSYGVLTEVVYPTLGSTEYVFENNTIGKCGYKEDYNSKISTAEMAYGYVGCIDQINGGATECVSNVPFTLTHAQPVVIKYNMVRINGGAEVFIKNVATNTIVVSYNCAGNTCYTGTGGIVSDVSLSIYMQAGTYELVAKVKNGTYQNATAPYTYGESAKIQVNYIEKVSTQVTNEYVGGLRIQKLIQKPVTGINRVKKYEYTDPDYIGCTNYSSGRFTGTQANYKSFFRRLSDGSTSSSISQFQVIPPHTYSASATGTDAFTGSPVTVNVDIQSPAVNAEAFDFSVSSPQLCDGFMLSSSSYGFITNINGQAVSYTKVREIIGDNTENGSILSEFNFVKDENIEVANPSYFTAEFIDLMKNSLGTDNNWKSGKLLSQTFYDANGKKVKKDIYTYDFNNALNKYSCKAVIGNQSIEANNNWSGILGATSQAYMICDNDPSDDCLISTSAVNPGQTYCPCQGQAAGTQVPIWNVLNSYLIGYYDITSQWIPLTKKQEILYYGNESVTLTTDYTYSSSIINHLNPIQVKVTNSNNIEHITKFKYPLDYASGTADEASKAINKMKEMYIKTPIEKSEFVKETGQTEKLISSSLNIYNNFSNIPLLKEVWQTELSDPSTSFVASSINGSGNFVKDGLYKSNGEIKPENVISSYDGRANVQEYFSQNHNKNSLVWSKTPDLVMASIKNAGKTDIAYHGFDGFEIVDYGWTNVPANADLSGTSKIGKSAKVSTATYPKISITPEGQFKTFMLSVWVQASATTAGKLVLRVMNGATEVKKIEQAFTIANPVSFVKQTLVADLSKIRTEKAIPAATTLKIEAYVQWTSGTFYIDEFRLHPIDAYMSSYVYDTKLNLIATSNEREEITCYFYDNFNRLQYVKDFENNVRSFNEYHYSSGGSDQNYVKTSTILVAGKTTLALAQAATQSERQDVVNYVDGLGRGIQTNQVNAGPAGHDIVSFTEYDAFGRVAKNYLPVPLTSNSGTYRSTIKTDQAAKYNEANYIEGVEITVFPFSESKFDNSPLNRIIEKGYVGSAWQLGTGKTRKMVYRANTVSDAVRNFSGTGNFVAGDLFVEEMINADGEKSAVFKDKLGRVILIRQYGINAANNKNTYTVYNLLGQVIYVIPQIGVKWMTDNNNWDPTNAVLNELIYKYTYDTRGRILTKKVPNKAEEKYFYDKRDRLILTKNGRSGAGTTKEYVFIKYDIQNRVVQSGLYYTATEPTQANINAKQLNESPSTAANGYTNVAFPDVTIAGSKVLTINFYDHYDTDLNNTADYTYISDAQIAETVDATFANTRGMQTVSKTAVLNNPKTDDAAWLSTVTFYNKYARAIQIRKTNLFASGSDVEKNEYNNFRGLLMKHKTTHTGVGSPLNVLETYEYTKSGLLTKTKQKVNSQTEIVLSNNKYNKLGTPITKQIHSINSGTSYLQDIDYKYNIRGWLTDINNVADNCGVNGSATCSKDVFALKLFYNTIDNQFVKAANSALFDGGISAARWKTAGMSTKDTLMYGYNYIYDEFNQLKDANFVMANRKKDPANLYTWLNDYETGKYDEHMKYDAMGNITDLTRTGKKLTGATLSDVDFDQLSYVYNNNQLIIVNDAKQASAGQTGYGFIDGIKGTVGAGSEEYLYDARGNVIKDQNKEITSIVYNHLDLPQTITFANSGSNARKIEFVYTASGAKLRKIVTTGTAVSITEYAGQTEYAGTTYANRAFTGFHHAEGKLVKVGTNFVNQYAIKDHLGNVRVRIQDKNANGSVEKASEILEETHYYPFGMAFTSNTNPTTPVVDNFKYNNKELSTEFGLNWYDYQARQYDPAIGRWNSIDPMAEKYNNWSPYNYVYNNPVSFTDPDGMSPSGGPPFVTSFDDLTQLPIDPTHLNSEKLFEYKDKAEFLLDPLGETAEAVNPFLHVGSVINNAFGTMAVGFGNAVSNLYNMATGSDERAQVEGDLGTDQTIYDMNPETGAIGSFDLRDLSKEQGDSFRKNLFMDGIQVAAFIATAGGTAEASALKTAVDVTDAVIEDVARPNTGRSFAPNTQALGNIRFDSNTARQGPNGQMIVTDMRTGKDFGVVRQQDGSYDWYRGQ